MATKKSAKKRTLSTEARKKIAAAVKKSWAQRNSATAPVPESRPLKEGRLPEAKSSYDPNDVECTSGGYQPPIQESLEDDAYRFSKLAKASRLQLDDLQQFLVREFTYHHLRAEEIKRELNRRGIEV